MVNQEIWQRLLEMRIGFASHQQNYTMRLAQENGWTVAHALRVEHEYRKFLYLMIVSNQELSPAASVDQAWHLHLTYSRHYWLELCSDIAGRSLHHNPYGDHEQDALKYREQYRATLRLYAEVFGAERPVDIWPDFDECHSTSRRCIEVRRTHSVQTASRRTHLALCFLLILGACSGAAARKSVIPIILGLVVCGLASNVLASGRRRLSPKDSSDAASTFGTTGGMEDGGPSGCGGGCGGD